MTEKNGTAWRNVLIAILMGVVGFVGGLGVNDVLDRIQCNADDIARAEQKITVLETTLAIQLPAIAKSIEDINKKLEHP